MRTDKIKFPRLFGSRTLASSPSAISLIITFLALAFAARAQESQPPAESVVQAARNARERIAASTKHPKIITNDELIAQSSVPSASPASPDSSPEKVAQAPKSKATGCDSANAETLKAELQSSQDELDQIRSQLSSQPEVISAV